MVNTHSLDIQTSKKGFWEEVFRVNYVAQRSWYELVPKTSLEMIQLSGISRLDPIIDIGGGDSLLVDHLLEQGYKNVSVLDISQNALENSKRRLGRKADRVTWIRADILDFEPDRSYALWHDRACLHFLTEPSEIDMYRRKVRKSLALGGEMIVGSFSESGPKKCSGLPIKRYNSLKMFELFKDEFSMEENFDIQHHTPSSTVQNYVFCRFKREKIIS